MKPVLLGAAAPVLAGAGAVVQRTADTIAVPFATVLRGAADVVQPGGAAQANSGNAASSLPLDKDPHISLLSEAVIGGPAAGGTLRIEDIRQHADQLQSNVEQQLRDVLAAAGVEWDEPLHLQVSRFDGAIEVSSDHPQRALIESILADEPDLSADIRQLTAIGQLLSAADEHREFADAYREDPRRAVQDYAFLFASKEHSVVAEPPIRFSPLHAKGHTVH